MLLPLGSRHVPKLELTLVLFERSYDENDQFAL
jgi:hypothetical protein